MNMKVNNNNKKGSNAKKIIPAVGMLSVSAVMLASSTFAWFTMSREVEVKNIQMMATVPEDIQISLGSLGTSNSAAASTVSLTASTGVLVKAANADNASNGNVLTPALTGDQAASDWSNTADISAYYRIGRLMPASSTTGANIFFTPDANGQGKTVKSDAAYYIATDDLTPNTQEDLGDKAATKTNQLMATLHADTAETPETWEETRSSSWKLTGDDGYYVDIPIWLRTSSTAGANLSVQAYVVPRTPAATTDKLYKAVRVSLLNPTQADNAGAVTPTNLIPVADGWDSAGNKISATPYDLGTSNVNSILNWYNRSEDTGHAVGAVSAVSAQGNTSPTYAAASVYAGGTTTAVSLAAGGGNTYGVPTKAIIRVWLEGEDPDCWNETAGQDWSINLKFNNETTNANGASKTNISSNTVAQQQPGG
jgi:hypothetical protein